ncbi:hypothetical protein ACIQTU_03695 [Brevundimonas sp. NPDC090276]|uniref:8-oxoguanine DNA glycosylase OGG fold protein n=1 Tax=Brevundimonas sp. NPDC090276 TaxID=3363956 RepID=UPI00383AA08D
MYDLETGPSHACEFSFDPAHLAVFESCLEAIGGRAAPSDWTGPSSPRAWATSVMGSVRNTLHHTPQTRDAVFSVLADLDDEDAWLTIMAWGGQRRNSGRTSWNDRSRWLPIVRDLRMGDIDALEAYRRFSKENIKGTGPAYFTKAIFFLQQPNTGQVGYIMDQWTAKSMELLQARADFVPSVHWDGCTRKIRRDGTVNWQATVSRRNGVDIYERYCLFVDGLAKYTQRSSEDTEEALFAGQKADWRKHIMHHWRPTA